MARLGATLDPPLPLGLVRSQPAVDLPGANRQQLLLDLWADSEPLADPGHPDRLQRFQPHRPGITSRFPKPPSGWRAFGDHSSARGVVLVPLCGTASPGEGRSEVGSHISDGSQCSGRIRSGSRVSPALRLAITLIDRSEVLPFRLVAHCTLLKTSFELGYILNGAITPPPVTHYKRAPLGGKFSVLPPPVLTKRSAP